MVQFRILLPYLTCFTLVLFQVLPSYANGGNHNGIVREDGFAIKEINKSRNLQASGLVIERWIYGKIRLSLAKIQWKNQEAILKCMHDSMFNKHERVVFEIIRKADLTLKGDATFGRNRVQHPLSEFPVNNGQCFVYTYAGDIDLDEFLEEKNWVEKMNYLRPIFYQILKGVNYLRNANVLHNDIRAKNIMIRPGNGPTSIEATIIDYDNCQLLAGRDGTMLEVKDFTNVKYLNMPSVRHCRAENFNIGRMIFETITDDLLNDGDFTKQRTRWLSYIEKAKGINKTKVPVQRLSEKTSIDSNETFLNDLDKIDAKTAHYLLPLLEIMDWLLTNTSADCQLPDKMVKALKLSKTSMILDRLANQCLSHMLCQNGIRD